MKEYLENLYDDKKVSEIDECISVYKNQLKQKKEPYFEAIENATIVFLEEYKEMLQKNIINNLTNSTEN